MVGKGYVGRMTANAREEGLKVVSSRWSVVTSSVIYVVDITAQLMLKKHATCDEVSSLFFTGIESMSADLYHRVAVVFSFGILILLQWRP